MVISIIISPHSTSNSCLVAFPGVLPAISSPKCHEEFQSAEWQATGGWLRLSLHTADRGDISEEKEKKKNLHNEIKRVQKA